MIEMLEMPPPCKRMSDGSIIRKIRNKSKLISFGHEMISSISKDFDEKGGNNSFLQCRLQVPKTLVITDTLSVAHWYQDTKTWHTDSISDHSFDRKSLMMTFKTLSIGQLVQSRLLHFPYKSWCLGPVATDTNSKDSAIHFSITTDMLDWCVSRGEGLTGRRLSARRSIDIVNITLNKTLTLINKTLA